MPKPAAIPRQHIPFDLASLSLSPRGENTKTAECGDSEIEHVQDEPQHAEDALDEKSEVEAIPSDASGSEFEPDQEDADVGLGEEMDVDEEEEQGSSRQKEAHAR
ncbi:hypothetical protein C8Q76DRAFT_790763 [Earliella scabrosa]|nr:hypothetical protein C8Q76DRAFT_790763 [Earliella scabrosa]